MDIIDLRVRLIQSLDQHIEREISELDVPYDYIEIENKILAGRDETFGIEANISRNEEPAYRNLWTNVAHRNNELRRAMGMVLLYSNIGPTDPYQRIVSEGHNKSEFSEHFWASYGDFQIRCCSLLDSVGAFLAFVFFGIVDAPFYFNQVVDALELKYTYNTDRRVLDGEPFQLTGRESWKVILKARGRYQTIRKWRDEIVHAFSPLMYMRVDGDFVDEEIRQILRSPSLDANKALEACKESYFLLRLAPLAADDIAVSFINTDSYHRNYYY